MKLTLVCTVLGMQLLFDKSAIEHVQCYSNVDVDSDMISDDEIKIVTINCSHSSFHKTKCEYLKIEKLFSYGDEIFGSNKTKNKKTSQK